jgi:acyl-CoA thioester hydrolase
VLFREEAVFRREILFDDKIRITLEVLRATADYSRWSIRHQIVKSDDTLAATIQVDGAWIDMHKRKLAVPDPFMQDVFSRLPKSQEFQLMEKKQSP